MNLLTVIEMVINLENHIQSPFAPIGNNSLDGLIPSELGSLSSVTTFDIGEYAYSHYYYLFQMTYGPHFHTSKSTITTFTRAGSNALTGSIPDEFANITQLRYFNLGKCVWKI